MNLTDHISRELTRIKTIFDETDPEKLCKAMGIIVHYEPMGDYKGACKGFFLMHSRIRVITVNNDLSDQMQRVILAHELGHAVLHQEAARLNAFHDFSLLDAASQLEYEANVFAAELLLDDQEVLELFAEGVTFFSGASSLNVPCELLDFKVRNMREKGCEIGESPVTVRSNYLKNIKYTKY